MKPRKRVFLRKCGQRYRLPLDNPVRKGLKNELDFARKKITGDLSKKQLIQMVFT